MVDDDPAKRLAIGAIIEPLGHPVVEAESGEAALKAVIGQSFAVILMDVQMPAMDGYETARLIRLRVESQHTPIIFVTAHTEEEAQLAIAYASGAVDFIFAPILPDILRAKITIFADLFSKSQALGQSIDDVTRLRDRFRDSEARTRSVLDNVADGIVTVGDEGRSSRSTPRPPSCSDTRSRKPSAGPSRTMVSEGLGAATGRRKDGSSFPLELDVRHVELGTGGVQIACMRNISERQSYVEALKYQALHDDLTDLPNRALFEDRVNHAIRSASRSGEDLALLLLDLDGFKVVNDTLGHQHGDALLKQVGERLVECLRDGDTVARIGGDEFGILPQPGHRPLGRGGGGVEDRARARGAVRDRGPRARSRGEHRHRAGPRARGQHRRPAAARRPGDVRRQARRRGLRGVRGRAGGGPGPAPGAAQRPAALRPARRAGAALPAQDRPAHAARRSAWRP